MKIPWFLIRKCLIFVEDMKQKIIISNVPRGNIFLIIFNRWLEIRSKALYLKEVTPFYFHTWQHTFLQRNRNEHFIATFLSFFIVCFPVEHTFRVIRTDFSSQFPSFSPKHAKIMCARRVKFTRGRTRYASLLRLFRNSFLFSCTSLQLFWEPNVTMSKYENLYFRQLQ